MILEKTSKTKKCFTVQLFFITCCLVCAGCAKLAHLEQLLTIKSYSDNKDMQEEFVSKQNESFDRLLAVVQAEGLRAYTTKESLVEEFGPPVFSREVMHQDKSVEECLYRYATEYWDSTKVYVYFDQQQHLVDWELIVPPPDTSNDKAT